MTATGTATATDNARTSTVLVDADDRRHRLKPSPLARESLIFLLFLPEEHLGCIAYTWVDGAGRAGSMVLAFGEDDERLFQTHVEGVQMSPDADFDDWAVGALRVQHGRPHQEAQVTVRQPGFSLDYAFEAMTPAFTYHDNSGGCPPFLADNRLEQSGRVRGTITIGDRVVDFDTTGHRDHSWGTRDWTAFHHYKWINVQSESGVAINLMHGLALDQLYQFGYVDKDGLQSPITSISASIDRDVEFFSYTGVELELLDAAGRTTRVSSGPRTSLAVWPAGGLESHDAAGPCTIDGAITGLMHVEEGWNPQFVERRKVFLGASFDSDAGAAILGVNRDVGSVGNS